MPGEGDAAALGQAAISLRWTCAQQRDVHA
jgi:hypothetical protein